MKQRAFTKSYLDVLESDAWHFLGINARRLIEFLMIENMRHGGKRNGFLLAPREQLEQFGIASRYISAAIEEVERVGLIDCKRGVGQRPSMYTLTWLPLGDGSAPSDRWRSYVGVYKGKLQGCTKGSHNARSDVQREVTTPQNRGVQREAPSKIRLYQGGDVSEVAGKGEVEGKGSVLEGKGEGVEAEQRIVTRLPDRPSSGKPNGRAVP
jgi:hypothetical protein